MSCSSFFPVASTLTLVPPISITGTFMMSPYPLHLAWSRTVGFQGILPKVLLQFGPRAAHRSSSTIAPHSA